MDILYALDLIGTLVFAISGTLAGIQKRLDMFGALFTGFITAVGGGTIRDVILGIHPIAWVGNPLYIYIIGLGFSLAFLFTRQLQQLRSTFFLFDTIGISVFSLLGLQKALHFGINPMVAVIMGAVSAVFGGALRDLFTNEIPLIFRKEIYAVACLLGGTAFLLMQHWGVPELFNELGMISTIILIRMVAVKYKLSLPIGYNQYENEE